MLTHITGTFSFDMYFATDIWIRDNQNIFYNKFSEIAESASVQNWENYTASST